MFDLKQLSIDEKVLCLNTISSNTFYMIVVNNLLRRYSLSVVRMGDGENYFMNCNGVSRDIVKTFPNTNSDWLKNLGVDGIEIEELKRRLTTAANKCTYFAPSISGILRKDYSLHHFFNKRNRYVDNFFVNEWTEEMKIALYKEAGHVLLIHNNPHTADSLQLRLQGNISVKVSYIRLTNWTETESVIEKANNIDAPLVLVSAGSGGKYIIPTIAKSGNIQKVCLDLGHAADKWIPQSLPINRPTAEKFNAEWVANHLCGIVIKKVFYSCLF